MSYCNDYYFIVLKLLYALSACFFLLCACHQLAIDMRYELHESTITCSLVNQVFLP